MAEGLEGITREQFEAFRDIRPGKTNPERMNNPFWEAMVRCGVGAFGVPEHFGGKEEFLRRRPVWCFSRMGMTRTLLPDDRIVCIAGEHEDSYDPHFAIYNDVIVRSWDGGIEIYGYPLSDFQPTDFHTATLIGDAIYIIGCIGYKKDRIVGVTPVYRLDLESMEIHPIEVQGDEPGLLHGHEAHYWADDNSILVWGGQVLGEKDLLSPNTEMWAFDLLRSRWRKVESVRFERTADSR